MTRFFTRERFGAPQFIAALLLLAFLAQCGWFIAHVPLTPVESNYISSGMELLRTRHYAGDQARSPLVALIAGTSTRIAMWQHTLAMLSRMAESGKSVGTFYEPYQQDPYRWFARAPFVFMGLMLGASVWYVSRRLYGNAGGYIALGLYAFSPALIARSSLALPEIAAGWGIFGTIFTAIAVAHTLYAPREVVLWNWRRITLMGISIALAVGAQFSCALLLLLALAYMWWAVPHRRPAALAILLSACVVALFLLWGAYLFNLGAMLRGFAHGEWVGFSTATATSSLMYRLVGTFYVRDAAASTLMFMVSLITYFAWRRTRFFGNTAPLLVVIVLLVLAVAMPQAAGFTFVFLSLPFAIVFASGVFADLLESKRRGMAMGAAIGVVATQAILGIAMLLRIGQPR